MSSVSTLEQSVGDTDRFAKVRISRGKRLLFLFVLLFFLTVGGDTIYRGYLAVNGRPASPSAVAAAIATRISSFDSSRFNQPTSAPESSDDSSSVGAIHPYYGYEDKADVHGVLRYFRERPDDHRDTCVLITGGSVAAICSNQGGPLLEDILSNSPRFAGQRIKVLNYAHGGYKQPQQLMVISYLASLGFLPDLVVNIDGFNEVALGAYNASEQVEPIYPALFLWGPLASRGDSRQALTLRARLELLRNQAEDLGRGAVRWGCHFSAILGTAADSWLTRLRRNYVNEYQDYLTEIAHPDTRHPALGPPYQRELNHAVRECVDIWANGSAAIKGICDAYGVEYLHVLQPTLHDSGSKPLTRDEIRSGATLQSWIDGVHIGYPLLRERAKQLRESGIDFLDLTGLFRNVNETLYYDSCHFENPGSRMMARAIAERIIQRG